MADDYEGNLNEIFRAKRLRDQAKRAKSREENIAALEKAAIEFVSTGGGQLLIVAHEWDYWPGTDRWRERHGRKGHPKREGRGVRTLIHSIEEDARG